MDKKIMMQAFADVVNERFGVKTVTLPTPFEVARPEFTVQNDLPPIDMTPVADVIDRAFKRQIEVLANLTFQPPAIHVEPAVVNIEPAIVRYEGASPNVHVEATHVVVDITPLAEAIQRQTECLERLIDKLLVRLDKGKEIEIIKDRDGKITGARSTSNILRA